MGIQSLRTPDLEATTVGMDHLEQDPQHISLGVKR
jgi:hypothetical protein